MLHSKINIILILFGVFLGMVLVNQMSCTHEDQDLDEFISEGTTPTITFSETELLTLKTNTAPNLDGEVDGVWDDAQKLKGKATVPDPGDDLFKGYVGDSYDFTMRSLYDDENIYFLVEWTDHNIDINRQTWYFDPVESKWAQESRYPAFNSSGVKVREAFYEDKFSMLWNVNNSVNGWENSTCYASCHTGLGAANGFARHYTNGENERIDMWHWKSVRNGIANGQIDDQYQGNAQPNGRASDDKESGGYTNNLQELDLNGSVVKVPLYVIPGKEYYFWITKEEIDDGTAKLITSVDANGVLSYDGGSVDPNTDLAFQREGTTVGAKGIPSVYIEKWVGNRGDLLVSADYNGSGWVMEIQRKLKTNDTEDQDVDFSSLEDQPFGVGVFDNAALAHAIKANLILKFDK